MELTDIATFATPTSVVKFLLLGRSGSLPRCARILSGLKEDFLRSLDGSGSMLWAITSKLEIIFPEELDAPFSERASSSQVEAGVPLHASKLGSSVKLRPAAVREAGALCTGLKVVV